MPPFPSLKPDSPKPARPEQPRDKTGTKTSEGKSSDPTLTLLKPPHLVIPNTYYTPTYINTSITNSKVNPLFNFSKLQNCLLAEGRIWIPEKTQHPSLAPGGSRGKKSSPPSPTTGRQEPPQPGRLPGKASHQHGPKPYTHSNLKGKKHLHTYSNHISTISSELIYSPESITAPHTTKLPLNLNLYTLLNDTPLQVRNVGSTSTPYQRNHNPPETLSTGWYLKKSTVPPNPDPACLALLQSTETTLLLQPGSTLLYYLPGKKILAKNPPLNLNKTTPDFLHVNSVSHATGPLVNPIHTLPFIITLLQANSSKPEPNHLVRRTYTEQYPKLAATSSDNQMKTYQGDSSGLPQQPCDDQIGLHSQLHLHYAEPTVWASHILTLNEQMENRSPHVTSPKINGELEVFFARIMGAENLLPIYQSYAR